ncbi:MAG: GAF domain-containing protein [Anaerolineaceae bacterium]|nr:GAF domain-containing protein [Anaerolineaceae bacterium]
MKNMVSNAPQQHTADLQEYLPQYTLDDVIASFEAAFGLANSVVIVDSTEQVYYRPGSSLPAELQYKPIIVDHRSVGKVGLPAATANVQALLNHLAIVLSHLALETWRQRQLSSEALERYEELNLVYELGAILSQALPLGKIMDAVLVAINDIIQAEAGAVYVWDEGTSTLQPASFLPENTAPEFWMGRVRELALSTLYAYDDAQIFDADQVLCAPLRHDEERLGALVLLYEHPGQTFNADDVRLLNTLTHHTALFIHAARLLAQLSNRTNDLERTLKELQSTRDKLSRAERLSLIGQTMSSLVHDMKNPLAIILGYAGILQEENVTYEERKSFAGQIITYVEMFSSMSQEILDYTLGDENVKKASVPLDLFLRQVNDLLLPPGLVRPVKISIENATPAGTMITVDSQRFSRVFQNLVNNAVDAIEGKGGTQVVVRAEQNGDEIRFSITDDGPGVPPDIVDTMFEPFVTFGKQHGTGLGLAIVDHIVSLHGGRIRYETASGGGARFIFNVPKPNGA